MTEDGGHSVDLDTNLARSRDKQAGLRWPIAVDDRLDQLVAAAEGVGERTNRKELLAAIVATSEVDGGALSNCLRRYRTMSVRECLKDQPGDLNVVRLADRKPGPRPR
jgi:hypothetical protein